MNIGDTVRKLRKEKKLTLEALAFELDMDAANLSRMERGERRFPLELLTPLAQLLGTRASELLMQAEANGPHAKKRAAIGADKPELPRGYDQLSPAGRALVADMIEVLLRHERKRAAGKAS